MGRGATSRLATSDQRMRSLAGWSRPVGEPSGRLHLAARPHRGQTVLSDLRRTVPFAVGPISRRGGNAAVIVQQVGPGLMPGDDLLQTVTLEPEARLTVRGQSATKVYPSPADACTRLTTELEIGPGADLRFLPGELIPFRDAVLLQSTRALIAAGGRLALAEIMTLGRVAMGECGQFRSLDLRLTIEIEGETVLRERARLGSARRLAAIGRHGAFPIAGVLYLVGWPPTGCRSIDSPDAVVAIAPAADPRLIVARILAGTPQAAHDAVAEILRGCPV